MHRWQKIALVAYWLAAPAAVVGFSQIIGGLPFTLTNGTVADATQVMADFNQVVNNTNANAAKNGVNSDITALTALVTPLTPAQGGSTAFAATAASTSAANTQVVATVSPATFALTANYQVTFVPGFTNTGAMTLAVAGTAAKNVFKQTFSGAPIALIGGEVQAGTLTTVAYDGTEYVLLETPPAFGISTNLSSATTTDLGTIASHTIQITGTTTITAFGSSAQADFPFYRIRFSGILTLTHNGTSLILPGAANIATAANDTALVQYLGSGNWQVVQFQHAAAVPTTAFALVTVQRFLTGTAATYTAPAGVKYQRVTLQGAGGGGSGATANNGSAGSAHTTFQVNSTGTAWAANLGGGGATSGSGGVGGSGGADGSTGTKVNRVTGGGGGAFFASGTAGVNPTGGYGGSTPFGMAQNSTGGAPNAPQANSGIGGSGAGGASATRSGAGGGGGEYVQFWVTGMTTATYTVGLGGTGGIAGTFAGVAGADGIIIVEEFYQ